MTLRSTATFQGNNHTEPIKPGIPLEKMLASLGYTPLCNAKHPTQRHRGENMEGAMERTEGKSPLHPTDPGSLRKKCWVPNL